MSAYTPKLIKINGRIKRVALPEIEDTNKIMLSGKLGDVRRQIDRHDKYLKVINDAVKNQQGVKDWVIEKEKDVIDVRIDMDMTEVQKDLVKRKVLQKCMEKNKKESTNGIYGLYKGRSVTSFNQDIETYIEDNTPSLRKERKYKSLMEQSHQSGFILGTEKVLEKVQHYFQDRWGVEYKEKRNLPVEENVFAKRRKSMQVTNGGAPNMFGSYKTGGPPQPLRPFPKNDGKLSLPSLKNSKTAEKDNAKEKKITKKQKLEKLTRKQVCSKPNCNGYIAFRVREEEDSHSGLPTIEEVPLVQVTRGL